MGRIPLADGTDVEWDLDPRTAELTLLGTRPGGKAPWMLSFVILPARSGCFPRMQRPLSAGDGLLLLTDGEHERGATSHFGEIHFVTAEGVRRWSLPVQNARAIVHNGHVVLACKESATGGFALVARRISLNDGKTLLERRILCPGSSITSLVTVKAADGHALVESCGTWGKQQLRL